jgi:hypothetical protein
VVDPDIPNENGATPLIAAIGNTLVSVELRVAMSLQLINHPRVNVNRRGTDGKLPLRIAAEANLLSQLSDAICRRILIDYDRAVRDTAGKLMEQLDPNTQSQARNDIQNLLDNPNVNVADYNQSSSDQLVNAINEKIVFLTRQLQIDHNNLSLDVAIRLSSITIPLLAISANTQLIYRYLTRQDLTSFLQLLLRL